MQLPDSTVVRSPSHLNPFDECEHHLREPDLLATEGRGFTAGRRPQAGILAANGFKHDQPWLQRFGASSRCPRVLRLETFDRFQAARPAGVLLSMASSSDEDIPRGVEFLFSRNRLNVAVSRAKAMAVLVCSPRLLETRSRTVDQMRLVNGLCAFVERAVSSVAGGVG